MRPFFYIVDQYFGNDSLEPFECIFMAPSITFAMAGGAEDEARSVSDVARK